MDPDAGNTLDPASLNKYAYARNNPANLLDPSGRAAVEVAFAYSRFSGNVPGAIQEWLLEMIKLTKSPRTGYGVGIRLPFRA